MFIGQHITSETKSIIEGIDHIKDYANVVQFFVDKPSSENIKIYSNIKKKLDKYEIKSFIHSSYTINMAKDWDETSWWANYLIYEIEMASRIGSEGIIVHLGKKLELSDEKALINSRTFLSYIHAKTIKFANVKIILETSSGQGTEMLYDVNDLIKFIKRIKSTNLSLFNRIGLCIDTCHIFASGYNINDSKIFKNYVKKIDDQLGKDFIKVIHLNDSQDECGQKKDRHMNIGHGHIGLVALILITRYFLERNVPIILETSYDDLEFVKKIREKFNF